MKAIIFELVTEKRMIIPLDQIENIYESKEYGVVTEIKLFSGVIYRSITTIDDLLKFYNGVTVERSEIEP